MCRYMLDAVSNERFYLLIDLDEQNEEKKVKFKIGKNNPLEDVIRTLDCPELVEIKR